MILLSVQDSLQFVSKTTDWMQGWGSVVQAAGALGAIVVIIWGFTQFNKDSRDKQKQINSLTALADESKTANELLKSQLDEDKRRRKLLICPKFVVVFNKDESMRDGKFKLQNKGGEARNIGITNLPNIKYKVHIGSSDLQRNELVELSTYVNQGVLTTSKNEVDAQICFSDIDDNFYCQHLTGRYLFDFSSSKVFNLDKPTETDLRPDELIN